MLPVTAIVTRLSFEPEAVVRVTHLNGVVETVSHERLAEFVTESGNAANFRSVAVVDVLTPALHTMPGVRLVDTPGLGSALAHNTKATHTWLPNMSAAIIAISSERPLSREDLELIAESRRTASHVVVMLTKIDLLSDRERAEVRSFLAGKLCDTFGAEVPVLLFSTRLDTENRLETLRDQLIMPIAEDVAGELRHALVLKISRLA